MLLLQEVPEKTKEGAGGPWQFVGLLSLFDPPRHDSAETIRRALHLGVNVKMITGNYSNLLPSRSPFSQRESLLCNSIYYQASLT